MTWRWIRQRPRSAAAWTLFVAVAAAGCGDDTGTGAAGATGGGGSGQGGTNPQGGGGEGPLGGGGGGVGGQNQGGQGGGTTVCTLADETGDVAQGSTPYDATPSPDGCTIYFTGYDTGSDSARVFSVASDGGNLTTVAQGDPLVSPFGIATSTDGETLYIADPAADGAGTDGGMIFSVEATGGTPTGVTGSEGLYPRSLEVRSESGSDQIYFTGRTAAGAAAIFRLDAGGGGPTVLASGGSLGDPSGITISSAGDVFFVDTVGDTSGLAIVKRLDSGSSTPQDLLAGVHVGYPAGIAISQDDQTLYVSGLDPDTLHDVLFIIDIADIAVTTYTGDADTPLDSFQESAGIHRAKNTSVFAWADSKAGAGGTVFAIQQ